jgi:hypothetical protein
MLTLALARGHPSLFLFACACGVLVAKMQAFNKPTKPSARLCANSSSIVITNTKLQPRGDVYDPVFAHHDVNSVTQTTRILDEKTEHAIPIYPIVVVMPIFDFAEQIDVASHGGMGIITNIQASDHIGDLNH